MKEISIKSKIVGRAVDSTTASKGGAMPVDMSAYLPKSVWEKVFKLVTDEAGNEHLFSNLPFASKYGITMFADDGSVSLPDLYQGLPIDGVTLVRDENGVLKVNPDIKLGGVDAEYVDKRINALINGAPAAYDTLKEIADVLQGNVNSIGDILAALGNKADKATTLLGYGITDAVTLGTNQDILGLKNFTKGLQIDGLGITKSQEDVVYIDANLVVRGGITMYATDAIDVPSIIDALPSATYDTKGISAFNPNDFSVVDGYVSFIGKGGVDESVLADYAKKTDLSGYLPLSGGQMTGNIGYTLDKDEYSVGIPATGIVTHNSSLQTEGVLNTKKTFIGTAYNGNSSIADHVISIRYGNTSKAELYGLYINTTTDYITDSLKWNRQINGTWQGERIILDSVNWSQYVTADDGGNYLPLSGGTMAGTTYYQDNVYINEYGNIRFIRPNRGYVWSIGVDGVYTPILSVVDKGLVSIGSTPNSIPESDGYRLHIDGNARIEGRLHTDGIISNNYANNYRKFRLIPDQNSNATYLQAGYWDGSKQEGNLKLTGINGVELESLELKSRNVIISHGDTPDAWLKFFGQGTENKIVTYGISGSYVNNALTFYNYIGGGVAALLIGNDLLVSGGITMYSDIRKKTKLQDVELSLKQIADAPLIEHYYNSDENRTTHVGSIAQYWASMNDWFCKLDSEGYYTMEIQNAALASAISIARELQRYETRTDRTIRELKKRIRKLEDEIEDLKK